VKIAPRSIIFVACCASILGSLGSATAFHHDLSATTAITLVGSQDLPRIPPQGRKVMVLARDAAGGGTEVVKLLPFTTFSCAIELPARAEGQVLTAAFTGSLSETVEAFASQFGVSVMREGTAADDIVHNLRTAIIDGEGKLITSLNGSEWSPADLVAEIRRARAKR